MMAKAPTVIESHRSIEKPVGSPMLGSPVGTLPTSSTSCAVRSSAEAARIPRITTMNARGTFGALKRISSSRPTATARAMRDRRYSGDVEATQTAATGAVTAATEADGPVTTWRVAAKTAYSVEAPRMVYRPYCAGTPITAAYASAWGTTSAQTE